MWCSKSDLIALRNTSNTSTLVDTCNFQNVTKLIQAGIILIKTLFLKTSVNMDNITYVFTYLCIVKFSYFFSR